MPNFQATPVKILTNIVFFRYFNLRFSHLGNNFCSMLKCLNFNNSNDTPTKVIFLKFYSDYVNFSLLFRIFFSS